MMEGEGGCGGRRWRGAALACLGLCAGIAVLVLARGWLQTLLIKAETLAETQPWSVAALLVALFTLVAFPVAIGYLVLTITAGYLLGMLKGLITVVVAANLGVAFAHYTLRLGAERFKKPLAALKGPNSTKALLKVIGGPHAFRLVFFTRLTPIPFGIQNTVFAIGNVGGIRYHIATLLGLLPAQVINVYLGSTLRSMHDVFHKSHVTEYVVFAFQITISVLLMIWVVQKARRELAVALTEAEADLEGGLSTSSSAASLLS